MAIAVFFPGETREYKVTGIGVTEWVPILIRKNPSNVTLGIGLNSGSGVTAYSATLEYTNAKDPDVVPASLILSHSQLTNITDITEVTDASLSPSNSPISFVRINVTASDGDVSLFVTQSGV